MSTNGERSKISQQSATSRLSQYKARGGFRQGSGGRAPPLKFTKHWLSKEDLGGFRLKILFIFANFKTDNIYIVLTLEECFNKITAKKF